MLNVSFSIETTQLQISVSVERSPTFLTAILQHFMFLEISGTAGTLITLLFPFSRTLSRLEAEVCAPADKQKVHIFIGKTSGL